MRWIIIRTAQRTHNTGSISLALRHFSIVLLLISAGLLAAAQPSSPKVDANDLSFYHPSAETAARLQAAGKGVDNVIFCIGDGMGLTPGGDGTGEIHRAGRQALPGETARDRPGPDPFGQLLRDRLGRRRDRPGLRRQDQQRHDRNDPGRTGVLLDPRSRQGQRHGHGSGGDVHDQPCDTRQLRLPRQEPQDGGQDRRAVDRQQGERPVRRGQEVLSAQVRPQERPQGQPRPACHRPGGRLRGTSRRPKRCSRCAGPTCWACFSSKA